MMSGNSPMLSLSIRPDMVTTSPDRLRYTAGQFYVFCTLTIAAWWWVALLPYRHRLLFVRPSRQVGDRLEVDLWVPVPSIEEAHAIGAARAINDLLEPFALDTAAPSALE